MNSQVVDFDIDALQPNPLQPRGNITPESLADLVSSVKQHGVLEPLVVAKTPAGYQIIAGERRWRASKIAGLKTVPVIIKETSPRGMLEMAIIENVQREDLNPIDRAQAFLRLMEEFGLTNREVADRVSKSPAYISNSLKLLTMPDALKDGLLSGLITEGHARALSSIQDPKLMVEAYKIVLREGGSVRRAEEIARRVKQNSGQSTNPSKEGLIVSDEIDKMKEDIFKSLGGTEKTQVKLLRSRVHSKLILVFKGSLEETEERLQKVYKALLQP
jgi:ParB family transcriptional regulator, chromosome partitioning protein